MKPTKAVIVLGANGALGQQICLDANSSGYAVIAWGRQEVSADISTVELASRIDKTNASVAINCLSMNGLDRCAKYPDQAFEANSTLPLKLALISKVRGVDVVHISTDNVFKCDQEGKLYNEQDEVGPTTTYGVSKLIGESSELFYQKFGRNYSEGTFRVIRLPMLFGPTNGKQVVSRLVSSLQMGKEALVAKDVFTTPLYTPEAAVGIISLLGHLKDLPRVTHFCGGPRVSLFEFMQQVRDSLKIKGEIKGVPSQTFNSIEPKPQHGGLASSTFPAFDWRIALGRYTQTILGHNQRIL